MAVSHSGAAIVVLQACLVFECSVPMGLSIELADIFYTNMRLEFLLRHGWTVL